MKPDYAPIARTRAILGKFPKKFLSTDLSTYPQKLMHIGDNYISRQAPQQTNSALADDDYSALADGGAAGNRTQVR